MALVNNGVKVSIESVCLPSTITLPTYTEVTDYTDTSEQTLEITKASVETGTIQTTFDNLITAIKNQINALYGANYDDVANDVTYYIDLKKLYTNFTSDDARYKNTAIKFIAEVVVYSKIETA